VRFDEELGADAFGITREFMSLSMRNMIDSPYMEEDEKGVCLKMNDAGEFKTVWDCSKYMLCVHRV
jgi:hypothetical protein